MSGGKEIADEKLKTTSSPFLGVAKEIGSSGDTFALEVDPRDPASGQYLAYSRPLWDLGTLRLGASFNAASGNTKPTDYHLAVLGKLPKLGGEAGISIAAAPPSGDENASFDVLANYKMRF